MLDTIMSQQPHKRQYRELSDETKAKISQSMKQLPRREQSWCDHLSQALIDYWKTVPHCPTGDTDTTLFEDEK